MSTSRDSTVCQADRRVKAQRHTRSANKYEPAGFVNKAADKVCGREKKEANVNTNTGVFQEGELFRSFSDAVVV